MGALALTASPAATRIHPHCLNCMLTRRHAEVLAADGPLILPSSDPRSEQVCRVASRLVTALEEADHHMVCDAAWPPSHAADHPDVSSDTRKYEASGVARSSFMPFRPVSSNPLKKLEGGDWNLYVIDMVSHASRDCAPLHLSLLIC